MESVNENRKFYTVRYRYSMLPVIGICLLFIVFWIEALNTSPMRVEYIDSTIYLNDGVRIPYSEVVHGKIGPDQETHRIKPPLAGIPC